MGFLTLAYLFNVEVLAELSCKRQEDAFYQNECEF